MVGLMQLERQTLCERSEGKNDDLRESGWDYIMSKKGQQFMR